MTFANLRIPAGFHALDARDANSPRNSHASSLLRSANSLPDARDETAPFLANMSLTFYEFFCGGGMARMGLGPRWQCLFANDIDPVKAESYRRFFRADGELVVADVRRLSAKDLPGTADLAWASFPCQDLSLAGPGAGLSASRSGAFWPFRDLVRDLRADGRAPRLVVLENVVGAITSHRGADFAALCRALTTAGYRIGPLVVDAAEFLPQSRPRLFVIAVDRDLPIPRARVRPDPDPRWHTRALQEAFTAADNPIQSAWIWWRLEPPPPRRLKFADILDDSDAADVAWHSSEQTERLLAMMTEANARKVSEASRLGRPVFGTLYRRTRIEQGRKVQRAEVRFDDIAGCLRTPAGGSSRQTLLAIEGSRIRSRLLTPREAARLMGIPDDYPLPRAYNAAYHLAGDGVVVPVVSFLSERLFEPILL
jgi:DNA (cytosine-5)-methyltransferase 1